MSHFYASIKGNRGMATRCGSASSGMEGHIRGWDIGAEIHCDVDGMGDDIVRIYRTDGSRGYGNDNKARLIAEFTNKWEKVYHAPYTHLSEVRKH